ncbi:MAG: type II secretion system F family protein [Candidatus Bathyarchaeia archaeon]|nr:type II secretion system F family protein [Candidatus Bathyarchaeota archaeon]
MKILNKIQKLKSKPKESILGVPELFIYPYKVMGDKIIKFLPFFKDLKTTLIKANIKVSFEAYVAFMLFFSSLTFFTIFILAFIFSLIMGFSILLSFMISIALSLLSSSITLIFLHIYPSIIASERKRILEEELPYIASHMAILAKAGLPPERIIRSLAALEGIKSIASEEAKNIIRDIDLFGVDIISAMEAERERSPLQTFSDFIDGVIGVSRSGGDLTSFFLTSARSFMDSARISARKLVETLGTIAEAYVAILVVFPLIAVVMLAIMGIIGGNIAGFNIITLMQLIAYILVPFLSMIILLMLDGVMPKR